MPYPFTLRPLPYSYEALCPEISDTTLHFHHDKHLQTYVDNLNKALADCAPCQRMTLEELLQNLDALPADKRIPVRNNGGGVYNHYLISTAWPPGAAPAPPARWPGPWTPPSAPTRTGKPG